MLYFIGELTSLKFQLHLELGIITGFIVIVLCKATGCSMTLRESAFAFMLMVSFSLSLHVFPALIFGRPI